MNVKVFEYQYQVEPKDIDALHHVNNVVYLQYVQDVATKHLALVKILTPMCGWWADTK